VAPIDGLLLLLAAPGGSYPMDRIRIMKGLFLLSQEGPAAFRELYHFEPYRFGPFDKTVYNHLDWLQAKGFVKAERNPASGQPEYSLTPAGQTRAEASGLSLDDHARSELARIKNFVTTRSFVTLLRQVYAKYPSYAVRSDLR
jgi:uncharacterized protein